MKHLTLSILFVSAIFLKPTLEAGKPNFVVIFIFVLYVVLCLNQLHDYLYRIIFMVFNNLLNTDLFVFVILVCPVTSYCVFFFIVELFAHCMEFYEVWKFDL